jgi:hypothetical protein
MRLTLRTLLAWLDDTLSASEVREIGKQVAESPYAQELVERIQRVTRQRRLTVPSTTGPDATDPNLVASYLDNELDQDLVPEYEKLCLTSDVHMAEVASVHQILSLIGQKAKVPQEAKNRMYHLIRGREAIVKTPRSNAAAAPAGPVSEPIVPWVTPPPPSRPWYERYGPLAGALALLVVLCWSAWLSLRPGPESASLAQGGPAAGQPAVGAPPALPDNKHAGPARAAVVPAPVESGEPTSIAKAEVAPEKPPGTEPAKEAAAKPELPPGVIATTEMTDGILLRYNTDAREWEQLVEPTPLRPQDRLLSLDPFRCRLAFGSAKMDKMDLVGETEIVLGSAPPNQSARFQLAQGRVVLRGGTSGMPFEVQFAGKSILITPPPGGAVGVSRINSFEPGVPESATSVLKIFGSEGDIALQAGDVKETLTSPGSLTWDGASWTARSDKPGPDWVTETKPTAYDQSIGELFLKHMRPDRRVIANIVEALEDDQKDVRRLALRALRVVGDLSFITPELNKADDPMARREAIRVLRTALAQGPDSNKAVRDQLDRDFGQPQAVEIRTLLIGFNPKEARDEATYARLVKDLSAPDVAVRELALDNLRSLTGRGDLQYDPDKFEGPGLKAWRDLLRDHELRPAVPTPAPAPPPTAAAKAEK